MANISVIEGDITRFMGGAIVNAANRMLHRGGGVCGAIHSAAGKSLSTACHEYITDHGWVPIGGAALTKAGNLDSNYVIHAVGPRWFCGINGRQREELLSRAYHESLNMALGNGIDSIAFPCISTGHYGFPHAKAAPVAVRTVLEFTRENPGIQVWFYCPDSAVFALYTRILEASCRGNTQMKFTGQTQVFEVSFNA